MRLRRLLTSLYPCVLFLSLFSISLYSHADRFDYSGHGQYWGGSDEDTILIEDQSKFKISYSKALKAACKNFLGFDFDDYFSGGNNKKNAAIRHLDELSERTYYRLRVDQDEVYFKFTINL